jgi:hypothetical protein
VTIAAGIDVGNSSTEVVLARLEAGRIEVLGAARAPTRRAKGSPQSLDGAAALVRRLEREHGVRIEVAVAARLRPVETRTASVPEPLTSTGRLRVIGSGARTAGGRGFAVGRPRLLDDAGWGVTDGPAVAVLPAGIGYQLAVERLTPLAKAGLLLAVLLADDEAVLVSNRLSRGGADAGAVPVVDEIDVDAALRADLVAVEVAGPGSSLHTLTDPLRLITVFGLAPDERTDAARLSARLHDCGNAVVALGARAAEVDAKPDAWVQFSVDRLAFTAAHHRIVAGRVGLADGYQVNGSARSVDDLWTVDLSAVADTVLARRDGSTGRPVGMAALHADAPLSDPSARLGDRLGVPVLVGSESRAGWTGGVSTPGADQSAVVIDIGGGTIDAVSADDAVIAAGGGELLTASVAILTGTTSAAAEWVKRGPAQRVEAPQLLLGEDGGRGFLDRPAPAETIGALVVDGPAGLLPFSRTLAPGEWRALRLRLKVEALGGNVIRALRTLEARPATVIVVGGPAGDEEVLSAVARALPDGVAIGRGDVAGSLGHRYAVAYGLLALLHDD